MHNFEGKNKKNSFALLLKEQILSGQLKPGQRLPTERELAEIYGISRGSVNQGLLDLERDGFVRIAPRKGAFVEEYMKNATPETLFAIMAYDPTGVDSRLFYDLMKMRMLIEGECARLACSNWGEETLNLLQPCAEKVLNIDPYVDTEMLVEVLYSFHRALVRAAGNSAYTMIFQSFEKMLRRMIRIHYSNTSELAGALPRYRELASALLVGDEEAAYSMIMKILEGALNYMDAQLRTDEGKSFEL